MTLRNVIYDCGATCVKFPKELEKLECDTGDLTDEILFNYFNSDKFQNDISSVLTILHNEKKHGFYNFSLFFTTTPVTIKIFPHNS